MAGARILRHAVLVLAGVLSAGAGHHAAWAQSRVPPVENDRAVIPAPRGLSVPLRQSAIDAEPMPEPEPAPAAPIEERALPPVAATAPAATAPAVPAAPPTPEPTNPVVGVTRAGPDSPDIENQRLGAGENRRLTREEIAARRAAENRDAREGQLIPLPAPETRLLLGAELRQLDKMTGRTDSFELAVGQTVRQGRMVVRLDACRASEADAGNGAMAFMTVWDTKVPETPPVFSGWMFAESPALSALDHPRYDLWVIRCTTSVGPASPPSE